MIKTKSVKIGALKYKICFNKEVASQFLGNIFYNDYEIRLQRYSHNKKLKKKCILQTLMHEIIHAIDENVKFSELKEHEENADLISSYVIENLEKLISSTKKNVDFDHFQEYIDECEIDIDRKKMTLNSIIRMLNENKVLAKELKKGF